MKHLSLAQSLSSVILFSLLLHVSYCLNFYPILCKHALVLPNCCFCPKETSISHFVGQSLSVSSRECPFSKLTTMCPSCQVVHIYYTNGMTNESPNHFSPNTFLIHIFHWKFKVFMLYCNLQPQLFYVNRQGKLFTDFPR